MSREMPLKETLYVIGGLTTLYYVVVLVDYFFLYAFPPRKLGRYLHPNKECWALVTGASDGIGFGLAEELCLRGFNVILHSRNRDKLERKRKELVAQYPKSKVEIAVGDSGDDPLGSAQAVKKVVAGKHLTVLINNLALSRVNQRVYKVFEDTAPASMDHLINANVFFFAQLIAAVLPDLKQNTPSLMISVGSLGSFIPTPYVQLYAACKSFQMALSSALNLEMVLDNCDMEVFGAFSGIVRSASFVVETGFFVPTSRVMGRAILDMVGCRRRLVTPFFPHFMQQLPFILLPDWISSRILSYVVNNLRKGEDKELKEN